MAIDPSSLSGPEANSAPVGASPATGPVPNKGMEAAGLAKLSIVVRMLESIIPEIGAASEVGKSVLKSLTDLSKHLSNTNVAPGVEQSQMEKMMLEQRQQGPQIAQLRKAMMQDMSGAAPAAPMSTQNAA